jgi:hypothetical protein
LGAGAGDGHGVAVAHDLDAGGFFVDVGVRAGQGGQGLVACGFPALRQQLLSGGAGAGSRLVAIQRSIAGENEAGWRSLVSTWLSWGEVLKGGGTQGTEVPSVKRRFTVGLGRVTWTCPLSSLAKLALAALKLGGKFRLVEIVENLDRC